MATASTASTASTDAMRIELLESRLAQALCEAEGMKKRLAVSEGRNNSASAAALALISGSTFVKDLFKEAVMALYMPSERKLRQMRLLRQALGIGSDTGADMADDLAKEAAAAAAAVEENIQLLPSESERKAEDKRFMAWDAFYRVLGNDCNDCNDCND